MKHTTPEFFAYVEDWDPWTREMIHTKGLPVGEECVLDERTDGRIELAEDVLEALLEASIVVMERGSPREKRGAKMPRGGWNRLGSVMGVSSHVAYGRLHGQSRFAPEELEKLCAFLGRPVPEAW